MYNSSPYPIARYVSSGLPPGTSIATLLPFSKIWEEGRNGEQKEKNRTRGCVRVAEQGGVTQEKRVIGCSDVIEVC